MRVDRGVERPVSSLKDPFLYAIIALGAVLIFWSLGERYLWQDEAETAMLAKSILRTGLPIAHDGKNVVSQELSREFGPDYMWRWSPWLQFYLAAGSFALFGPSTLSARLPFAVLGLSAVPLTYWLARRFMGCVNSARLSSLILATSVPFLLHTRQARWYAVTFVIVSFLFICLEGIARGKKWACVGFAASAALLFYANFFVAIGVLAVLLFAAPAYQYEKTFLWRLVVSYAFVLLGVLPGLLFFNSFDEGKQFDLERTTILLTYYLGFLFTFLLPLPLAVALVWFLFSKPRVTSLRPEWTRGARLLLIFCLSYPLYLSLGPWHMFRYLSVILPLTSVLLGLVIFRIFEMNRYAGIAGLAILIFTNILHVVPLGLIDAPGTESTAGEVVSVGPFHSPLASYLYEITHATPEPEPVIVKYLKDNANPSDVVFATYGDLPIQFYTDLRVLGTLQAQLVAAEPDWIIVRRTRNGIWMSGRDETLDQVLKGISLEKYHRTYLPCSDSVLGNCPEPPFHSFVLPGDVPSVLILYK